MYVYRIVTTLSGKVGFQIQYQLTFCLWVMTFDPTVADRVSRWVLIFVCSLFFNTIIPVIRAIQACKACGFVYDTD